jgi:hypothetical protein
MRMVVAASLTALALSACQPATSTEDAAAEPAAEAVAVQGHDINVTLSPAAAARLLEMNERITISAFWYGPPAQGVTPDEGPEVNLGSEETTISGTGGPARITGDGVDASRSSGPVNMNINVFSAREGGPDNVLDCEIYDAVAAEAPDPIELRCTLIGEAAG